MLRLGEQVDVQYVLVPVRVRSAGRLVPGLPADRFRLRVDGDEVAIQSFEQGARAVVDLVVLQDLSGSMDIGAKMDLTRRALSCLLERAQTGDRWAIATFSTGEVAIAQPFTADREVLSGEIAAFRGWGTTAIRDAVSWLPELVIAGGGPRQAALVITDGIDNASTMTSDEALERVRRARLPVYSLALHHREPGVAPPGAPDEVRYGDILRAMADQTGGRAYDVTTAEQADRACAEIDHELRYQYVLGFATTDTGASRYRRLIVEVHGGSYEVTYRQGYEGRPPGGLSPPSE